MTDASAHEMKFDFGAHEQAAVNAYLKVFPYWSDVAAATGRIIEQALKSRDIRVHSVQFRPKDPVSFGRKAAKPSDTDPLNPKYPNPLTEINDLSETRIITFFPRTIDEIDAMLHQEFEILERSDKTEDLLEDERFGYQSVHYLVRLTRARAELAEYQRFARAITEVQVRTILQHAWAEIEHDIQYKSSAAIPRDIRRRFMALAGMLELADREFQAIQDQDAALNTAARTLVEQGKYSEVEITPTALKLYVDRRLGSDGRMSDFSYDWTVRLLKKLGFRTLNQIDECIAKYDDDKISRLLTGTRQGQLTRFEYLLLASMGEKYIERHTFAGQPWFGARPKADLKKLVDAGILPIDYDPVPIQPAPAPSSNEG
jgi:ppGpp synthetase/RelA/SpoT-type nucleotidyltranferase